MILLCVTVSCLLLGSSAGLKHETKCYGKNFAIPSSYTPPVFRGQLYFTPNGGSRRLVMDNGEAKDPRLKVSTMSAVLTDLTEKDDGIFSISFDDNSQYNVIKLEILDCAKEQTRTYGETFYCDIPTEAAFLEFTLLDSEDQPKVLWNRTDPQINKGGRGQVKRNVWQIMNVNQGDMGHYNFRRKDDTLLLRIKLTVQEEHRHYDAKDDGQLFIKNPSGDVPWTVTFKPEGEMKGYTLINAGHLVEEDDQNFQGRIEVVHHGIEIDPVKIKDSGTYEFRGPQGHLAQTAHVVVNIEIVPAMVYVIAVGVLFAVIGFCCCVKKCWSKRSSSKKAKSTHQAAATLAGYYQDSNQSGGQIYSAAPDSSHQPLNSLVSREPTSTSPGPSVGVIQRISNEDVIRTTENTGWTMLLHNTASWLRVYTPVNIHVSSPQPEVAPLGRQGGDPAPLLGSDCLSSDPEPRFELKGLPSAPPLSSDATLCDVYTSDKLNSL